MPYLTAAEPAAQQSYYSIQLLSGEPEMVKNAWQKVYELPYARIEKHTGQHMLRIGFWSNKQHATKQLALIRKRFPRCLHTSGTIRAEQNSAEVDYKHQQKNHQ